MGFERPIFGFSIGPFLALDGAIVVKYPTDHLLAVAVPEAEGCYYLFSSSRHIDGIDQFVEIIDVDIVGIDRGEGEGDGIDPIALVFLDKGYFN